MYTPPVHAMLAGLLGFGLIDVAYAVDNEVSVCGCMCFGGQGIVACVTF